MFILFFARFVYLILCYVEHFTVKPVSRAISSVYACVCKKSCSQLDDLKAPFVALSETSWLNCRLQEQALCFMLSPVFDLGGR